jgi:hypothetical protein
MPAAYTQASKGSTCSGRRGLRNTMINQDELIHVMLILGNWGEVEVWV